MSKTRKTQQYVREVKVSFKSLKTETFEAGNPAAVAEFVRKQIGYATKEHFLMIGVNNKNVIVVCHVVSVGTITETIVHPREVFMPAIKSLCSGIILVHNHPSGNPKPSKQDIETTKRMIEAGAILGLPVMDHVIVAENDYCSVRESGYIM